jgi:hypothetical protein
MPSFEILSPEESYRTDYGRAIRGIVNVVTKSGSNGVLRRAGA